MENKMSEMYVPYPLGSPRMNKSVSPVGIPQGSFFSLVGVDGRYNGGLKKFYGMKKLVDFDGVSGLGNIDAYGGPTFIQTVTFQKKDTAYTYRGFVVRWDSQDDLDDQQIDLVYTLDNGENWAVQAIWAAGNGITGDLEIDCDVEAGFLLVAVDTKALKVVYWNGDELVTVDAGPGAFSATLGAMTLSGSPSKDTSYQLRGNGVYQVAWRFYSSVRGIYSSLSNPVTIRLDIYKETAATGGVYFNVAGGDGGIFVDGDKITINGRVYEADDDDTYTGDVRVNITGLTTMAAHAAALANAINGDASAVVSASAWSSSVVLTAKTRGTDGNAYTLTKTEVVPNQDDITISGATLTGGGVATTEPEEQCKVVLDLPDNTAVLEGKGYADFAALFDTIDIFRTIDLGRDAAGQEGAIFYLEQSLLKADDWATSGAWDDLQITIGTMLDDALPFGTMYDPEKDIMATPPASGTIGRYQGSTFMVEAVSVRGGYDILHSSIEHSSPEYFSTYNRRFGEAREGRPLRFIPAADSLFALCPNAVIHIYKAASVKPLQFTRLHLDRGLVGKEAAHAAGNSILMISGMGLVILSATDGSMGQISAADRVIFDDWKSDLANIKSGYDSLLNASLFLNTTRKELLMVWHSLQTVTMLEGANFVGLCETADVVTGKNQRVYLITKTGLVVYPDTVKTGSGTMWDLSDSYTLNGTATSGGTSLIDSGATFHEDMVGALCYMTNGDNAGECQVIATVNPTTKTITFESNFSNALVPGDTYSISPVPFKVRLWPVQIPEFSKFNRWNMTGVSLKVVGIGGFTDNPNNQWRVGVYRNGGSSLEASTVYIEVSVNPTDSVGSLNVDGIDIEPYIEQIAAGVNFELTNCEVGVTITTSRTIASD